MTGLQYIDQETRKWHRENKVPYFSESSGFVDQHPFSKRGYSDITSFLKYLNKIKFSKYEITKHSQYSFDYFDRLAAWLKNHESDERKRRLLLELAYKVIFLCPEDMSSLYRQSFTGPIMRWVMECSSLTLSTRNWQSELTDELFDKTWYCSVTDSMKISTFYHINGISGQNFRPAFRELKKFKCDLNELNKYCENNSISRLALLEDFVGTGTQSKPVIKWASENLTIPILFCPLITTKEAVDCYSQIEGANPNLTVSPVIVMDSDFFVYETGSELSEFNQLICNLSSESQPLLEWQQGPTESRNKKLRHLGFWNNSSVQLGALLVMYTNTPNNSLPMIHHQSDRWAPLFPRVNRSKLKSKPIEK
jgi:hypothetical protein